MLDKTLREARAAYVRVEPDFEVRHGMQPANAEDRPMTEVN